MEDVITVAANLSTKGFEKGSKAMQKAVNSLSRAAQQMGRATERGARTAMSSIRRLAPMILGVGSAYGIISKAVSAFMSQNEQLSSKMNSVWTALGNVLGPIITQIINWVTTAVSYFLEFLRLLGITGKSASDLSKKANASAGQLQKTIAGFDELNLLNSGGGGGGGATLEDVDPAEWMKRLSELLKNKLWDQAADIIIQKMNAAIAAFKKKAIEFGDAVSEYIRGIALILARIINEVNWGGIGESIAEFLNRAFSKVDPRHLGAILVGKITIAFRIVTGFLETLDWRRVADILSGMVVGAFDSMANAIRDADWKKIGQGIKDFFEQLWNDKDEIVQSIFGFLSAVWDAVVDLLWGLLSSGNEEPPIVTSLKNFKDSVVDLWNTVIPKIQEIWDKIGDTLLTETLPRIIDDITETIRNLIDLISGDKSLFEFIGDLNEFGGALLAIGGIKIGSDIFKFAVHAKQIANIFGAGKGTEIATGIKAAAVSIKDIGAAASLGVEALGEMSVASSSATLAVGGLAAGAAGLLAALGLVPTIMLDSKLSTEYAQQAFDETGGSVENLAAKMNELADMASHEEDFLWDAAGATDALGYSMQEARYAGEAYNEFLGILADALGLTTDELKEQIAAADGDVTKIAALTSANEELGTSAQDAANTIDAAQSQMESSMSKWGETAETATEKIETSTEENIGGAAEAATTESDKMATEVGEDFETMKSDVQGNMDDINSIISNGFANAISGAHTWGSDLIHNFVNGMVAAFPYLEQGMQTVAEIVRSYLGFSEPEKGPLSNFHTFAPDMMQLFASGIDSEKRIVESSVADVAASVSDAFENSNFTIGSNVAALNSVGANVPFSMPVVAGGGIIPYSVADSSGMDQSLAGNAELLAAIAQLSEMIGDLQYALEHMQWIAQFGDLKAWVKQITKIQQQIERANG